MYAIRYAGQAAGSNNNNSKYKKQSDLPVTGNQIKKKDPKSGLISDYY